jgi:large subunit ribosomal protein L3
MSALLGKKVGMTGVFDAEGQYVPVTVVQLGPNYVAQVKTKETDGYNAIQLGFEEKPERKVNKPEAGHLDKAGVPSLRYIKEIDTFDAERVASLKPGAERPWIPGCC